MNTTRINNTLITSSHGFVTSGRQEANPDVATDTSVTDNTQSERIAFLNRLFVTRPEGESNNGVTIDQSGYYAESIHTQRSALANGATISRPRTKLNNASEDYIEIIRTHYINDILQALKKVQAHACTPGASVYINKVLHTIRLLEEKSPHDPALEVLLAFYDALAFDGLWATYTANQYRVAEQVLIRIGNESINTNKIENAIMALEQAGFDTMPYTFSLDDEDED